MQVSLSAPHQAKRVLSPKDFEAALSDYPFAVRQALRMVGYLELGQLEMHMPDGRHFNFDTGQSGPKASMIIHDLGFASQLAKGGDIGIAEAYLQGQWETPDLTAFLQLFCSNQSVMLRLMEGKPILRFLQMMRHWLRRNTKTGSKRNIHAHYDLGNRFYQTWLDPTMTYSSALNTDHSHDLEQAQKQKYLHLAQTTQLAPDHNVLEIGCGWGGFAEFAAKEIGCRVTGLTISQEQFDFARRRIFESGLTEKVEIKLQDYRDENGLFDRIASIEMFEAVGEEYWPAYFKQLHNRLKPGGLAGLQVITIDDSLFDHYRRELDFIRRYIFPGGMLPTGAIMQKLGTQYGLQMTSEKIFGLDYAATLKQWREDFAKAWPQLTTMGFDERFRRMWNYYLSYSEAGFRAGTIDVRQMVFARS